MTRVKFLLLFCFKLTITLILNSGKVKDL